MAHLQLMLAKIDELRSQFEKVNPKFIGYTSMQIWRNFFYEEYESIFLYFRPYRDRYHLLPIEMKKLLHDIDVNKTI